MSETVEWPMNVVDFFNRLTGERRHEFSKRLNEVFNQTVGQRDVFYCQLPDVLPSDQDAILDDFEVHGKAIERICVDRNLSKFSVVGVITLKLWKQPASYVNNVNLTPLLQALTLNRVTLFHLATIIDENPPQLSAIWLSSLEVLCVDSAQLRTLLCLLRFYLETTSIDKVIDDIFENIEEESYSYTIDVHELCDIIEVNNSAFFDVVDPSLEQNFHDVGALLQASTVEEQALVAVARQTIDGRHKTFGDYDIPVENIRLPPRKTADYLSGATRDLDSLSLRPVRHLASCEELYSMITEQVVEGTEVLAKVVNHDSFRFLYGTITKIREEINKFFVELKDCEEMRKMLSLPKITVTRAVLAYGKAHPNIDFPLGTRVLAYHNSRLRCREPEDFDGWNIGTIGSLASTGPDLQYLVFFDCDQEAYVNQEDIRLHLDQEIVSETEDGKNSRVEPLLNFRKSPRSEFLENFLTEKIFLHVGSPGSSIAAKYDRKTFQATILKVDRELFLLRFSRSDPRGSDGRGCMDINCVRHKHLDEWVYRGSTTKLIGNKDKMERRRHFAHRNRAPIPLIDLTVPSSVPTARKTTSGSSSFIPLSKSTLNHVERTFTAQEARRRHEAANHMDSQYIKLDLDWSRILDQKNHKCDSNCWTRFRPAVEAHRAKLSLPPVCSPFFLPLAWGWCRKQYKAVKSFSTNKQPVYIRFTVYQAPCGASFSSTGGMEFLSAYLRLTNPPVTYRNFTFDVDVNVGLMAVGSPVIDPDFALGLEAVPITVVNAVDDQQRPRMKYNTHRYMKDPTLKRLIENFSLPAKSCCSCKGDCSDSSKCECQQLTLRENANLDPQLRVPNPLYHYGLNQYKVQSGIYECNSLCLCNREKCRNYVVQRKISVPLQLFQTARSGWGVRTLVDLPHGTFVSTYAGEIMNEKVCSIREDDTYIAQLDFVADFENEKRQRGIDLPDEGVDEGIDVVDSFTGGPSNGVALTEYFDKENNEFLIDAIEEGNIGRFYNHSCDPNLFVQNVFADTHDLRLPWFCFFTSRHVDAGEELTWDYSYEDLDRGVTCHCGTSKCRGRLM